jgi:hypothetical protein
MVSQTIGVVELKLVLGQETNGFPADLGLKIGGVEQKIGENKCYFAKLSEDGQLLATQCDDNGNFPLVFWDYNSYSKSFIRLTEFTMTLQGSTILDNSIIFPTNGVWSGNKFVATYYVNSQLQPQVIVYDADKGESDMFNIASGEYGAAMAMSAKPVISPDGKYILVQSEGNQKLNIYDMMGNNIRNFDTACSSMMDSNPNWSQLLEYRWKNNNTIQYKFPLEDDSEYQDLIL